MFHWIKMDVCNMSGKIFLVSEEVFLITALPDAAFSNVHSAGVLVFPWGACRENPALISIHLPGESTSPGGRVHAACGCSGKTTMALMVKGNRTRTMPTTLQRTSMCSTSKDWCRFARLTVRREAPPSTLARRYRIASLPTYDTMLGSFLIPNLPGYCLLESISWCTNISLSVSKSNDFALFMSIALVFSAIVGVLDNSHK